MLLGVRASRKLLTKAEGLRCTGHMLTRRNSYHHDQQPQVVIKLPIDALSVVSCPPCFSSTSVACLLVACLEAPFTLCLHCDQSIPLAQDTCLMADRFCFFPFVCLFLY